MGLISLLVALVVLVVVGVVLWLVETQITMTARIKMIIRDVVGLVRRAQAALDGPDRAARDVERLQRQIDGLAQTVAYLARTLAAHTKTGEGHP